MDVELTLGLMLGMFVLALVVIFGEPVWENEKRAWLTSRDKSLPAKQRGRERLARNNPHLERLIFP